MTIDRRSFLRGLLGGAASVALPAIVAPYVPTKTYSFLGGILRPRPTIVDPKYGWVVIRGNKRECFNYGYNAPGYVHPDDISINEPVHVIAYGEHDVQLITRLRLLPGDTLRMEQKENRFTTYLEASNAWSWGHDAAKPSMYHQQDIYPLPPLRERC